MAKVSAAFSATPLTGEAPSSVAFTDASTNTPTQWFWDFGDGNTSLEQNPVHVYSKAGKYTVTLIASNAEGEDYETKVEYVKPVETTPGQENQINREEAVRGDRSFPELSSDTNPLSTDRNFKIDYAEDGPTRHHDDILQ